MPSYHEHDCTRNTDTGKRPQTERRARMPFFSESSSGDGKKRKNTTQVLAGHAPLLQSRTLESLEGPWVWGLANIPLPRRSLTACLTPHASCVHPAAAIATVKGGALCLPHAPIYTCIMSSITLISWVQTATFS